MNEPHESAVAKQGGTRTEKSALYRGRITHIRRGQPKHAFAHGIDLFYLDLDELDSLELTPFLGIETPGLFSFRRRDYRKPEVASLKDAILDDVEAELAFRPTGGVRVLTQVRSLGFVFNPVSFYYCFDSDETLRAVVAEINNTPWNERYAYVLKAAGSGIAASFGKRFHVSPFWPMNHQYDWELSIPGQALRVTMRNTQEGEERFLAQLSLQRQELTRSTLIKSAARTPLSGLRTLALIYGHAFVLWRKGARFFDHPGSSAPPQNDDTQSPLPAMRNPA